MNTPNTLLKLLNVYRIEVPRVQRDYVQGKKDEHSTIVRTNLLNDIKSAYEGKQEPLDLNFIYGKTTEDNLFYPVDGQQRLTTLFLIHLYAFSEDDTKTKLFLKFSYQARTTTRDFFKELILHRKEVFSSEELPEAVIKDAAWFVDSWKYDPSVNNVLNALNDIRAIFKADDLRGHLEEQNNPKVYFQFVKLDELGMEDDLYIKLNARGRELTAFENFKSRFLDRCIETCPLLSEEFKNSFDGLWADYIWNMSTEKEDFDAIFLRFFETVFLNSKILKSEANKAISKNWVYNLNYSSIPEYLFFGVRNMFNYLAYHKSSTAERIVQGSICSQTPYPNKVLFYAVYVYLSDENNNSAVDNNLLNDWLRFFRNLVDNSRIEEADTYLRALSSIDLLKAQKRDILSFLASDTINDLNDLSGFSKEQFEEECKKARIMCKDSVHKKIILDAEDALPYFSGQIRSILFYSEFEKVDDKGKFDKYLNAERALFIDKKPLNGNLLRKTLCAIGDYRLSVGNYKTLCIDDPNESSRTWSLKRLFSNHGSEVKELLDSIDVLVPIEPQLNSVIASKAIKQDDWRYCFTKYADVLFPLMSVSHLRMFTNNNEELIVPNKQSSGDNYSVYLYVLQYLLKKESIASEYFTEKGANGDRYLEVKDSKVRFKKKKFYIENASGTWHTSTSDVLDEVVNQIKLMP